MVAGEDATLLLLDAGTHWYSVWGRSAKAYQWRGAGLAADRSGPLNLPENLFRPMFGYFVTTPMHAQHDRFWFLRMFVDPVASTPVFALFVPSGM